METFSYHLRFNKVLQALMLWEMSNVSSGANLIGISLTLEWEEYTGDLHEEA